MDFLIQCNAAGQVVHALGQIHADGARVYGLAGVGPGGFDGLAGAYDAGGKDFTRNWIGQYSAAVADQNTVILAQSSLGLGRAYWHLSKDGLVVGSDLLAVAKAAGNVGFDPEYFARFLMLRPILDRTPFAGVRQLTSGATAVFTGQAVSFHHPWRPQDQPEHGDPLDRLEMLLNEALDTLLPEGTPVVSDISGGTDSSIVVAMAHKMGHRVHGISHVAERGIKGDDRAYATLVAERFDIPLQEFNSDTAGLATSLQDLPDQPGSCRYRMTAFAVRDHVRTIAPVRYMTGVGGDVVFDYRGLVPAFLADPLVAFHPRAAWRLASDYDKERGGNRGAAHFLRYVGLPIAAAHLRRRNLGEPLDDEHPDWVNPAFVAAAAAKQPARALSISRPSARYLWETLFDLASGENIAPVFDPATEVVHPLLHRPLVEFLLGLPMEVRRGMGGDRALQRALLARLGLPEVAARQDKGSAQQLREMQLAEAGAFLDSLGQGELARRGWVEPEAWARAINQTAVGASPKAVFFAAAIECELWLRRAAGCGW